jgi:hypothetical protein
VAMPKRVKVPNTDVPSVPKEKVRAYPVLYHINGVLPARLRELGFLRVQDAANGRAADF